MNILGDIQCEGNLHILSGNVNGAGSAANNNRVNISGNIEAEGDIDITGGKGDDTAGNVVSISGKIGSS
ncbi:MAG: hypothetical protein LBD61_01890, partial [Endomicrobium sp.]|nr:hypothetical protein [Endomicrobium sp.]